MTLAFVQSFLSKFQAQTPVNMASTRGKSNVHRF